VGLTIMSVEQLQTGVSQLSVEELGRFSAWFEEFLADQWDRQIEADILAGGLDAVGKRADEDFETGRCTLLP
jgi:hypothetical protein